MKIKWGIIIASVVIILAFGVYQYMNQTPNLDDNRYRLLKIENKDDLLDTLFSCVDTVTTRVYYHSLNMYDFVNMSKTKSASDYQGLEIYGDLILPKFCSSSTKCPVMVASHGSLSWRPHHDQYFTILLREGIGIFKLHPFGSRGVESTVGNQTQVTHQMIISDAYAALNYLATNPNVDSDRVGFMGTSLGGGAALYSAWNPELMKKIFNTEKEFKIHVAIYPPCFAYPHYNVWTNNTVIIMIGTADQWTPAEFCTEIMGNIYSGKGYNKLNKKLYLYNDEHHAYDDLVSVRETPDEYNFTNCRFSMDPDGKTYYRYDRNEPFKYQRQDGETAYIRKGDAVHLVTSQARTLAFRMCATRAKHLIGYTNKLINKHVFRDFLIEIITAL